ncbi:uncharacterized protein VNE69_08176 [Vairimorpha necatrix]|uniref:Uncharacterized protein n=1 Tax=Vairimorpha necatrix TaxID=6039 RepID=A0AAX4JEM8_9MICR
MFFNILLVFGSTIENCSITLKQSFNEELTDEFPLDLTFKPKKKEYENEKYQLKSSNVTETINKITNAYSEECKKPSESLKKPTKLGHLLNFLSRIKMTHILTESVELHEDRSYISDQSTIFNDLLEKWKSENIMVLEIHKPCKFVDPDYNKKYIYTHKYINIYQNNFCKILTFYLPQIRNKIECSTIQEISKNLIIDIINTLCCGMSYFEQLRPHKLNYVYHSNTLIHLYKLLVDRFPYLFNCFNICKKFIDLYEMIIQHYIKKVSNSYEVELILYNMSKNLKLLIHRRENFLKNVKEIILILENFKLVQ